MSTELPDREGAVSPGPHLNGAAAAAGVTARVCSMDGWAVRNAVLTITDLAGSQAARADAGDDGLAVTGPLAPGTYTAIVIAPGYAPAARTMLVTAGGSATLGTVTLARAAGAALPPPGRWTIDPAHSAITITTRHMGLASVARPETPAVRDEFDLGARSALVSTQPDGGIRVGSPDSMKVGMYSFDCRDAAALASFWSRVLRRPADPGATPAFATIGFNDNGPTWMFHQPDGELATGDNRLMLDLGGEDDWAEQAERIEALGAERVSDNEQDGIRWVVFRDIEGNTFRIFAPRP